MQLIKSSFFFLIHLNVITAREKLKMGQSASGSFGNKGKEFDSIVERCYQTYFANNKDCTVTDFYRAVCETVEEINKKLGSTQINVPKTSTLQLAFNKYFRARDKGIEATPDKGSDTHTPPGVADVDTSPPSPPLTKEEFQEILQEVIVETGFTGIGAKDILMYIFGIPVTALMFKQRLGPKAIPNDLFIPAVTSATVFLLAKLHKI